MAEYCATCGMNAVGKCPVCHQTLCANHFGRSNTTYPQIINLPRREQIAFLAVANSTGDGWACFACRVRAGQAATGQLTSRRPLPTGAAGIMAVIVLRLRNDEYSYEELRHALQSAGGLQTAAAELYPHFRTMYHTTRVANNQGGVLEGVCLERAAEGSNLRYVESQGDYYHAHHIKEWVPARLTMLTSRGLFLVEDQRPKPVLGIRFGSEPMWSWEPHPGVELFLLSNVPQSIWEAVLK